MGEASGVELRKVGITAAAVAMVALALAPAAQAVQFDVSRLDDPAPNGCVSGVDCSLREAIVDANATPIGDVVNVPAPPAGQSYQLTLGQIAIEQDLTITGEGASTTTIDGPGFDRVFEIGDFMVLAPEVEITGVTITGGQSSPGGGINLVAGTLVLRRSVVTDNHAIGEGAGFGGGLAIRPAGTAIIEDTTFSHNTANTGLDEGGVGGGIWVDGGATLALSKSTIGPGNTAGGLSVQGTGALGGGIAIDGGATATLLNVTVSGNSVSNGLDGRGGGIFTTSFRSTTIDSSTLVGNQVVGTGGAGGNIGRVAFDALTLRQTIVAAGLAASGGNCEGPVITQGHNLESPSNQCGFSGALFDQALVADPLLGPLADNTGPTFTHALLDASPAIDTGAGDCPKPDTDQRGLVRAQGPVCDIGAFELQQGTNLADPLTPPRDICFGREATIIGDKGDNTIMGTPGDDVIVAKTGTDQVLALEGDDIVCARGTEDTLKGGPGDDILRADGGEDTLKGGPGDDRLNGANDDDKVQGGGGDDQVHGGAGNDDLNGGSGKDSCYGNKGGNDRATGCEEKSGIP